jgi:hypothetical protein
VNAVFEISWNREDRSLLNKRGWGDRFSGHVCSSFKNTVWDGVLCVSENCVLDGVPMMGGAK